MHHDCLFQLINVSQLSVVYQINFLGFDMFFVYIICVMFMLAASSVPSALMSIISGGGRRFEASPAGILSFITCQICFIQI